MSTDFVASPVIVIGGAVRDLVARPNCGVPLLLGTSNKGCCIEADGGVGRNVAEVLAQLGCRPSLYTAIGDDERGKALMERFSMAGGVDCSRVVPEAATATYLAVLNETGDLHTAIADMDVFSKIELPSRMSIINADYLVIDANLPFSILKEVLDICIANRVHVCFEPTSVPKAKAVVENVDILSKITFAFPNVDELLGMADSIKTRSGKTNERRSHKTSNEIEEATTLLLNEMNERLSCLVVTMGEKGVLLATKEEAKAAVRTIPVDEKINASDIANTTGAGDSFCGAFLAALMHGKNKEEAVKFGMKAAILSLSTRECAISPNVESLRSEL